MGININIRNVPEWARDGLHQRAKVARLTYQQYLNLELERILESPGPPPWAYPEGTRREAWTPRAKSELIVDMLRSARGS